MATGMSTTMDLEYLINCDICFEVYKNPQNLKCGHCFCQKCVDKIKSVSGIICPMCKQECENRDIRPDYKTQSLVDSCCKSHKSGSKWYQFNILIGDITPPGHNFGHDEFVFVLS